MTRPEFNQADVDALRELIEADEGLEALRAQRPWEWYVPHAKQLAFHTATQEVRALFPGNRFGKTSAAAMEAQWFATGTHPHWPIAKPGTPGDVIWACPSFDQFELLLPELQELIWGRGVKYNRSSHIVTFPGGGRVWAWSRERDWKTIKGIAPRSFIFDEDTTEELWNEHKARGFGKEQLSVIITNTPTQAMGTFLETEVYEPWLKLHKDEGLTEDEACEQQRHPSLYVMTRGGIEDNPAQAHNVEKFKERKWSGGAAEAAVRLKGGFRLIGAGGVFDAETLQRLEAEVEAINEKYGHGTTGYLRPRDRQVLGLHGMARLTARAIKDKPFDLEWEEPGEHGRITIWEKPRAGHDYTLGFDAAYGLDGSDWDCLQVLDCTVVPPRQVCAAWGHWGNRFSRIVYPVAKWYNDAFIMGERQVGLFTLQELAGPLEYGELYRQRVMDVKNKRTTEKLGWHRGGNDITLQNLRNAADEGNIILRCPETLAEMGRLTFERPETGLGWKRDSKVRGIVLRGGKSPDKTIALCYALQARDEIAQRSTAKKKGPPKGWAYTSHPDDAKNDEDYEQVAERDAIEDMLE
jgi:hypothetical protein